MEDLVFSLSAEEVALAYILIGRQEAAKRHLLSAFGNMDAQEVRGRLMAAYGTLAARGLAVWLEEEKRVVLDGRLEPLVDTISNPDYSVAALVLRGDRREIVACHFGDRGGALIKDRELIWQEIRPLDGTEAARSELEAVLNFPTSWQGIRHTFTLDPARLDEARKRATGKPQEVESLLADAGLDGATARALASDLAKDSSRGMVVRLDCSQGVARATAFLLTLRSPERGWIIHVAGSDESPMVEGKVASREELRKELDGLFS